MGNIETNYFVCTLGEASHEGIDRPYQSVNDLIAQQARDNPDRPAIGFYTNANNSSESAYTTKVLTFSEIAAAVDNAAIEVQRTLVEVDGLGESDTIALLMQSSPTFLFTWLGLIRLGHPVLLLAPQLSASAAAQLCRACAVSLLLVDEAHSSVGKAALAACPELGDKTDIYLQHQIVVRPRIDVDGLTRPVDSKVILPSIRSDGVAYLHHTSGTSSGSPKPIPQTHAGAIAVLPRLHDGMNATFTTTPLYHGGPADIFRAWSSGALIWLFPSQDVPIIAKNIIRCLEASNLATSHDRVPHIKYFASVPYILQMMAEDDMGLDWLRNMELVGVGGAALPAQIGYELVEKGVNLVSRFGSAECGFLLSSHRDYDADKDWQYLRLNTENTCIEFEPRDESLFELVVKANWPHMAKSNRDDGSFLTYDLFEKHPTIANAWRYHSRADSQIALITGKKFDPSSLEHDLVVALHGVSDVLVFGEGHPYPGALVFRNRQGADLSDTELLGQKRMQEVMANIPTHAQIPLHMLIAMPYIEDPLERSSKGSILRSRAGDRYHKQISAAYHGASEISRVSLPDAEVVHFVTNVVMEVISVNDQDGLERDADLFSLGIDSIAGMRVRQRLLCLIPDTRATLPATVVQQCGSITALAQLIIDIRNGQQPTAFVQGPDILNIVRSYTLKSEARPVEYLTDGFTTIVESPGKKVLLTGATGSLGSHVLSELCQSSSISHVYVLVRGTTLKAAQERVTKALSSRRLPIPIDFDRKVSILQCKLSDPDLGVSFMDYSTLQNEVDVVLHLAWSVNFLLPLRSFKSHFAGIQNLLNLCSSSTKRALPRFVFCSSVAAVSNCSLLEGGVEESIIPNLSACGSTGYAESKLTAELLLAQVATTFPSFHNRITIIRVGQLSADTKHGIWNSSEAYPQILAATNLNGGMLPDLGNEELLTWLPVDVAAKAFLEASFVEPSRIGDCPTEHVKHKNGERGLPRMTVNNHDGQIFEDWEIDISAVKVLHLLNPETSFTFTDFLYRIFEAVDKSPVGPYLKLVTASEWLLKLDEVASDKNISSSARVLTRLLPFWKQAYAARAPCTESMLRHTSNPQQCDSGRGNNLNLYKMHNSLIAMPALASWLGLSTTEGQITIPGKEDRQDAGKYSELLEHDYVKRIWDQIQEETQDK